MPARIAPACPRALRGVVMENWKDGLRNSSLDPDTRLFLEAVYEMPLELVVAFEADRDRLADHFMGIGVKGRETAEAYATEIMGLLVWKKFMPSKC